MIIIYGIVKEVRRHVLDFNLSFRNFCFVPLGEFPKLSSVWG
jgi:hypothetical protein